MTARAPSVADAIRTIVGALTPTGPETVALEAAPGRTLAAEVTADVDLPLWDNSAMDGYACRADDVRAASASTPVALPVAETIAAGAFPTRDLATGEAMRIMTGAPVPAGADSVVRVEDTDGGTTAVLIRNGRDAGGNIRRRGEDVRAGDVVLRGGGRVGAPEIALLAALGCATVVVHRAPRIAILSSGDELVGVEHGAELRAGRRVVSANNHSLAAIVREAGGEPLDLGIVADDLTAMSAALERGLDCDLIVTSGGISVGGHDYTRPAVEALGGEIAFWRVPMRPGYNSAFGTIRRTPWLGVPGNPVSALVAGEVLLRPAVRALAGSRAPFRATQRVTTGDKVRGARDATAFARATVGRNADGELIARLAGAQGSAILSTSVRANALLIVPPGMIEVPAGAGLDALILRDESVAVA
ncbi:MAG TPA: gephyrin-like molybdotransferase Glp [Gemmatimonadaceae bacterium]